MSKKSYTQMDRNFKKFSLIVTILLLFIIVLGMLRPASEVLSIYTSVDLYHIDFDNISVSPESSDTIYQFETTRDMFNFVEQLTITDNK